MDQELVELCDEYTKDLMGRREFIWRLSVLAGGVAAAHPFLPLLENSKGSPPTKQL